MMEGPGMSLFQGAASIHINNSAQDRLEEQEELEDQKRRNEEVPNESFFDVHYCIELQPQPSRRSRRYKKNLVPCPLFPISHGHKSALSLLYLHVNYLIMLLCISVTKLNKKPKLCKKHVISNLQLQHKLANAFDDLLDDDEASSVNSSGNFTLDAAQNNGN